MINDVTVFNIREYLSVRDDRVLGEEELCKILSEFLCRNIDRKPCFSYNKGQLKPEGLKFGGYYEQKTILSDNSHCLYVR